VEGSVYKERWQQGERCHVLEALVLAKQQPKMDGCGA